MPLQEVLILAMTHMLSGICTAGFTREPDPITGLRWVRPVRDFDTLQPGDMTDADGRHLTTHVLHGVVDGQTSRHGASRGIQIQHDLFFRVLRFEKQQLGDDSISNLVIDGPTEEYDTIF